MAPLHTKKHSGEGVYQVALDCQFTPHKIFGNLNVLFVSNAAEILIIVVQLFCKKHNLLTALHSKMVRPCHATKRKTEIGQSQEYKNGFI